MDHLDLYKRELQHLRGSAREFADRNPGVAGTLALAGDDPDLERLIEAHAFLTAGVHARLDAAAPPFRSGRACIRMHGLRLTRHRAIGTIVEREGTVSLPLVLRFAAR